MEHAIGEFFGPSRLACEEVSRQTIIERTDAAQQGFSALVAEEQAIRRGMERTAAIHEGLARGTRAPDFYNGQTAHANGLKVGYDRGYAEGLQGGRREAATQWQDADELYEQGLRAGYGKGATERNTLTVSLHAQLDRISVIHHMVMHHEPYGDIEHFILFGDET